jgi:O-antigen ligase
MAGAFFYYWIAMSRQKALGAIAVLAVLIGVLTFAPSAYLERLQTISAYQQDGSAMGRLQVWGASIRMAIDHPLGVGGGNFSSAYGRYYMPSSGENVLTWGSQRWLAAHSIYFKVLGEYGVLGLLLLLALIHGNIRDNLESRRRLGAGNESERFSPTWPALLNMSIVGYAVCGAFLGGISYPHLFLLSALTVTVKQTLPPESAAAVAAVPGKRAAVPKSR